MKATMEIRTKAVVFYEEGIRSAKEIGETYSISERTGRRWAQNHRDDPENGLKPKKTGPRNRSLRAIPASLEQRIIRLKGKYPAWGAGILVIPAFQLLVIAKEYVYFRAFDVVHKEVFYLFYIRKYLFLHLHYA